MTTLDQTSNPISKLQSLVMGDRNTFIFFPTSIDNQVKPAKVAKFLLKLDKLGYAFSNPNELFNYSKHDFKRLKSEFVELINSTTKDGMIFRTTFGESEDLTDYSSDDWHAILAQYSITYSWSNQYLSKFGKSAESVLNDYVGSMSSEISE